MWTVTWPKQDPLCTVHCTGDGLYTAQHTIMGWVDTGHSCSSSAQCQQLLREWKCIFSPYLGCFIADLSSTRWSLWRFIVFDRERAPAAMWRFKKKLFGKVAKYLWCRIEEWWVMVIVPPSVIRMWESLCWVSRAWGHECLWLTRNDFYHGLFWPPFLILWSELIIIVIYTDTDWLMTMTNGSSLKDKSR